MPHSLIAFLAPSRIAGYRSFLKVTTDEEIYRAYCWNYALSASVFPLMGCVEMQLRDRIHKTFSRFVTKGIYSSIDWYDHTATDHYPLTGKPLISVEEVLCDPRSGNRLVPPPNYDDVVASLTFGFWLSAIRDISNVNAPNLIPKIFPNHSVRNPKKWGDKANRSDLSDHIKIANDFRNRVAHHEPLFKFRYKGKYPKHFGEGVANLRNCIDDCMAIVGWVDQSVRDSLEKTHWYQQFCELATEHAFRSWVTFGTPVGLNQLRMRTTGFDVI